MRQFVAVAELLHFGKAAVRLNMAQPPLSQAIRRLELELGVQLFDRTKRAVELTDAGGVLLAEARRTLMQAELARTMTQRAASGTFDVRVSFIGPALYRVLPGILLIHRARCADVTVRLFERTSVDQIRDVLNGKLDVGFVTGPTGHIAGLASVVMERSAYLAAVPADWDIARQTSVSLRDLADLPLVLPPPRLATYFSEPLAMFETLGITPRVTQEAAQAATMLSLVSAGLGCSILGSGAAQTKPFNVKFLKIDDAPPHRPWELMMIWMPEAVTKTTADFIEAAKDHVTANPHLLDLSDAP